MNRLFKIFSSVRLTVALLCASFLLVFFGTIDQVHYGIREVQHRYFESLLVFWQYPKDWVWSEFLQYLRIPLPGGFLIGFLLLVNLVLSHFRYFRKSAKIIGISVLHLGVLFLVLSGFLTSYFQEESQMWIDEGARKNYSKNPFENELVIIDKTDPEKDHVFSIPIKLLRSGSVISYDSLPFKLKAEAFYPNADLVPRAQAPKDALDVATRGMSVKMGMVLIPRAPTYEDNEVNAVSAYVRLMDADGDIGTWLVSNVIDERFPAQSFEHEGHEYQIAIRFKRTYYRFSLELKDFRFDRYPGTEIPRNFSSLVNIIDPDADSSRQVLIYMNHPLRYAGLTFYQASFAPNEKSTMLQVVKNPSRILPYLAVALVGLGLLMHFTLMLVRFLKRR